MRIVLKRLKHPETQHLEWVHASTAHNPTAWFYTAETLLESAEHLKGGLVAARRDKALQRTGYMDSHYSTYGMLLGYALESILKGIWVRNRHALVKDGKLVKIAGVGEHQLLQLARKVGVRLTSKESDVVNRLSAFVRFAGRYPIPVRAEEMKPKRVMGRGTVNPRFFNLQDFETAEAIVRRLLPEIDIWPRRLE